MKSVTHYPRVDKISTILVCNMRVIGDVILTTPLISILKEAYPEAEIDFLVNVTTGEFLRKDTRVRNVISRERIDMVNDRKIGGKGYFRDIFRKYDLAINMNVSDRGNFAVLLAGKKARVGFYKGRSPVKDFWKKLLFTHPLPHPGPLHVARFCQVVGEALGIRVHKLDVKVFWDKNDEAVVDEILERRGVAGPFCVIHPFARWQYKFWNFDYFAEVSDAMARRFGLQPIWTSSPLPSEKALLAETVGKCRVMPVAIPGELSLNQMAYLISRASLYIGLDTAITHIAATTGVPMVALFGPTPLVFWAPWDNETSLDDYGGPPAGNGRYGHIWLIRKKRECSPCGKMGCIDKWHHSQCLLDIKPEEVIVAAEQMLAQPPISTVEKCSVPVVMGQG